MRQAKEEADLKAKQSKAKRALDAVMREEWSKANAAWLARNRAGKAAHKASMDAFNEEKKRCKLTRRLMMLSKPDPFVAEKPAPKLWLEKEKGADPRPETEGTGGEQGELGAGMDVDEERDVEGEDDDDEGDDDEDEPLSD